jgi:hypothetical protein
LIGVTSGRRSAASAEAPMPPPVPLIRDLGDAPRLSIDVAPSSIELGEAAAPAEPRPDLPDVVPV